MIIRPTKKEAEEFSAYYKPDTAFSAHARLLQSKWRHKNGLPAASYGNFIEKDHAKSSKANFLTDNIKDLLQSEIISARKLGALIGEPRIWVNTLSSQPLCFNLFGELALDLDLATNFFKEIFPGKIKAVTEIKFEYSPGRRTVHCDSSAFDVFVLYENLFGKKCFIGIEVKYAESLREESKKKAASIFKEHQKTYTSLTTPDIFKPNAIDKLQLTPLSQIWRDHMLALACRFGSVYDDGFFVFLFPAANKECQNGVDKYLDQLINNDEERTFFFPRHLEDFIHTLKRIHPTSWTTELRERYLGS